MYARKFGGPERAAQIIGHVTDVAAASGIEFHLDRAVRANTLLAHRLLWFAEPRGVQIALKEELLRAYFTDGRNVADHDTLVEIAAGVGLAADRARAILAGDEFAAEVRTVEQFFQQAGITGVPAIIIERKHLISGGQPPEVFEQALRQIAAAKAAQ